MKFQEYITEARDPKLKYIEKQKSKIDTEIDKVTVSIAGNESGKWTKLAREYQRLKSAQEKLKAKQDLMNIKMTEDVINYFDAQDEVSTRILETCSMTLTVSKKTVKSTTVLDLQAVIDQLTEMVPELTEKVNELIKANTKVISSEVKPSLRVKVNEAFDFNSIKQFFKSLFVSVRQWAKGYDKKLNDVKKLMEKIK
jgi:hypothetical protein